MPEIDSKLLNVEDAVPATSNMNTKIVSLMKGLDATILTKSILQAKVL